MGAPGKIKASFGIMVANYPTYDKLTGPYKPLGDYMHSLPPGNTSCCIQISHALNKAGLIVPPYSWRRDNEKIGSFYYIRAVDELEGYLSGRYGRGEDVRKVGDMAAIKRHLKGPQGILVFRDGGAGFHTELWDEDHILQDGSVSATAVMDQGRCFGQPRVLFYEVNDGNRFDSPVPGWLQGWWEVFDGNKYYYYFSDQNVVTYTDKRPQHLDAPPLKSPGNEGDVTIIDNYNLEIDWNPSGGDQTVENFNRSADRTTFMNGTSNRFAPLTATKM